MFAPPNTPLPKVIGAVVAHSANSSPFTEPSVWPIAVPSLPTLPAKSTKQPLLSAKPDAAKEVPSPAEGVLPVPNAAFLSGPGVAPPKEAITAAKAADAGAVRSATTTPPPKSSQAKLAALRARGLQGLPTRSILGSPFGSPVKGVPNVARTYRSTSPVMISSDSESSDTASRPSSPMAPPPTPIQSPYVPGFGKASARCLIALNLDKHANNEVCRIFEEFTGVLWAEELAHALNISAKDAEKLADAMVLDCKAKRLVK